jgi:hypothetical protein
VFRRCHAKGRSGIGAGGIERETSRRWWGHIPRSSGETLLVPCTVNVIHAGPCVVSPPISCHEALHANWCNVLENPSSQFWSGPGKVSASVIQWPRAFSVSSWDWHCCASVSAHRCASLVILPLQVLTALISGDAGAISSAASSPMPTTTSVRFAPNVAK